jgi:hypothetical protein
MESALDNGQVRRRNLKNNLPVPEENRSQLIYIKTHEVSLCQRNKLN